MSEHVFPYRSLRTREMEGSVMIIVGAIFGIAVRALHGPDFALLAAAAGTYASIPAIALWARSANFERVTRAEEQRRHRIERAQTPIWKQAIDYGTRLGSLIAGLALFTPTREFFAYIPALALGSFLIGAVAGTYLAIDARREPATTGQIKLPFAERASRHAFGYIIGLAAALTVGALVREPTIATTLMFVAFLLAKLAADMLLSNGVQQVRTNEPVSLRQLRWAFPFALVWWGLPFGILATLMAATYVSDTPVRLLFSVFSVVAVAVAAIATAMALTAYGMGLVPRKGDAAVDSR